MNSITLKALSILGIVLLLLSCSSHSQHDQISPCVYDFTVQENKGDSISLSDYKGKVLLIVNTATACGFTPKYQQLEEIYEKYKDQGLEILDFPCNQFGVQAPGTDQEIEEFCTLNFLTTFPRVHKVEVNGENAEPLCVFLKSQKAFEGFNPENELSPLLDLMLSQKDPNCKDNSDIKWNFTKFLVGRDGSFLTRFEPTESMENVEKAVAEALN